MEVRCNSPASYRIRILGCLDKTWASRMGGMSVVRDAGVGDRDVTSLEGEVPDQAALFGILKTIYDLRLPLLSVELVAPGNGER
jgi:hypothetical protein